MCVFGMLTRSLEGSGNVSGEAVKAPLPGVGVARVRPPQGNFTSENLRETNQQCAVSRPGRLALCRIVLLCVQ